MPGSCLKRCRTRRAVLSLAVQVREKLYAEVARLYHDLDEGMQPISVFFPYLPIEAHRRSVYLGTDAVPCAFGV